MKLKIDFKILLVIFIFYITGQLKLYIILMLFAFLHECGHLIIAQFFGYKLDSILIEPLGVAISFKEKESSVLEKNNGVNSNLIKEVIIAVAGPAINFLIVILFYKYTFLKGNANLIIYPNILIGVFNLLPIYPLDGGRILKNSLKIFLNRKDCDKIFNWIMNFSIIILTAISSFAILYYKNIAILLIIIFLWNLVIKENNRYEKSFCKFS